MHTHEQTRFTANDPHASSTTTRARSLWLVPLGLVALSIVPVLAGAVRFAEIVFSATPSDDNARFLAAPVLAIVHIVGANLFAIFGAFQVTSLLRTLHRRAHALLGRVTVPLGFATALSGLFMTLAFPAAPGAGEGITLVRVTVGLAMTLFAVLGVRALVRRDYAAHGAWMLRLYALGIGAGTQFFTHLPWFVLRGVPPADVSVALMCAGWFINVLIAERILAGPRGAFIAVRSG